MEREDAQARRWLLSTCLVVVLALAAALYPMAHAAWPAVAQTNYVIHISVDGLGSSYLQTLLTAGQVPNFARLFREGAGTLNARADYDWTITLPNHTSQLTGRPVNDKYGSSTSGHRWETNITPALGVTLHTNRGFYVASAFDVAHDNGLSTGLYASKDKFVLFENSYNGTNGAPDSTGVDNGRDKIDTYVNVDLNASAMFDVFKTNMAASPTRYTFVHFDSADTAGHAYGWGSAQYTAAVVQVDGLLGQVFSLIESVPQMKGNTHIVLTADHGGTGTGHGENWLAINYTVPLVVWGPGMAGGAELYGLNGGETSDPGTSRVDYALGSGQPIRNGDAGNCALRLLGLGAIAGSSLDHLRPVCQLSAPASTATATATTTSNRIFISIVQR